MQSWGLVATVDEPAPLVAAFAAHHVALGAQEVHLYLDQPSTEIAELLAPLPEVKVTQCDADHWATHGRLFWSEDVQQGQRPKLHIQRQAVNAQHAYARAETDWLIHCDADEFLHCAPDALARELSAYPPSIKAAHLPNSERVWRAGAARRSIFDGLARHPFRRGGGGLFQIYGAQRIYLNQGILGYTNGKTLTRTGQDLFLGIHRPKPGRAGTPQAGEKVPTWTSRTAGLVHFDGLTPLHWMVKLARKAADQGNKVALERRVGAPRMAQIEAVSDAGGAPEALRHLHDTLRLLPEDLITTLTDLGQIEDLPVDIPSALGACLPGHGLDLSEDAFDAWLCDRFPDITASLAPVLR